MAEEDGDKYFEMLGAGMYDEIEAEPKDGDKGPAMCIVCGDVRECTFTADPYLADVENRVEMGWWCPVCYGIACDDI